MIALKCMSKIRIRWGCTVWWLMGLFCLIGRPSDARISTRIYTAQIRPPICDLAPAFTDRRDGRIAQKKGGIDKLSPKEEEGARKWNQMSSEERKRYQERYQQLKKMSPQERKRYEKWHQQWEQLSPDERRQIRQKLEQQDKLSPQELEKIRRLFKK